MTNMWIEFSVIVFIASLISIMLFLKIFIKPLIFIFNILIAILTSILYKIASVSNALRGLSDFSDNIATIFSKKTKKNDKPKKIFKKSLVLSLLITVISLFIVKQYSLDISKHQYFTQLMNNEQVMEFMGMGNSSNVNDSNNSRNSSLASVKENLNLNKNDLVSLNSSAGLYEYDENKKVLSLKSRVEDKYNKAYKEEAIIVNKQYYIKIIFENGKEFLINPKHIIKTSQYGIVNANSLNLRKEPKVNDGNIYCALKKDQKVNVIFEDINKNWTLVSIGEYAGFVYTKYIDINTNSD